jgi:hypothetical protein
MTKWIDQDGDHECAIYEDIEGEPLKDKGLISYREWGAELADLKPSRWGTSVQFDGKYFIDPHSDKKVGRLYNRKFLSPWYGGRGEDDKPHMFYMLHWCGKEYEGEDEQFVQDLDWSCRRDFRNHYDWSDEIVGAMRNKLSAGDKRRNRSGERVRLEACYANNLDKPVAELCDENIIGKFKETMGRARRAIKHTSSILQELHCEAQHIHHVCMISYTACPDLKPPTSLLHKVVVKRMEGSGGEESYYDKQAREVLQLLSVICDEEKIKSQDGLL